MDIIYFSSLCIYKQHFFLTGPRVTAAGVLCVCKSGGACCYFLGYRISLRKVLKDSENTVNGSECPSCSAVVSSSSTLYSSIISLQSN